MAIFETIFGRRARPGRDHRREDRIWIAVLRADRAWFDDVRRHNDPELADLDFPRDLPERRFVLSGEEMAIGRRSRSRATNPEFDLTGPPTDPAVSAQHALLMARPGGRWVLIDLGSTNGTWLDDAATPIEPHTRVPVEHGSVIKLGAWTTITITVGDAGTSGTGIRG